MDLVNQQTHGKLGKHLKEPLYRNSFFIMLNSVSGAGITAIFWMLAAELYSKSDVGMGATIISSILLLAVIATIGLDFALIRFFHEYDKHKVLSTSAIITFLLGFTLGFLCLVGRDLWCPDLRIIKNMIFYALIVALTVLISLTGDSFKAIRKAEFDFFQTLFMGSRLFCLFPFIIFGALGIFWASALSAILTTIVTLFFLYKLQLKIVLKIDMNFLTDAFNFSFENYVVSILMLAPVYIIPILINNNLGNEETAHYIIAYSIVSLLFMIPLAISTALFIEGCYGEPLREVTIKSVVIIFLLLTPIAMVLFFNVSRFFGFVGNMDDYNDSFELLKIMVFSSFFVAVYYIYSSIKRIQKEMKELIFMSGLIFALLIGLSYLFLPKFGLAGVGYAWVISYCSGALFILCLLKNRFP
jgi:O-antigen/teichoic acid export membrane protein